ncbi:MAG: rhomboid family intramembrane serine protease [Bauldia sp.]
MPPPTLAPPGGGGYVPPMTMPSSPEEPQPPGREPIFNLPGVVTASILALGAVHVLRALLPPEADEWIVRAFAFVPFRLTGAAPQEFPGGTGGAAWTFVTYAVLHANVGHIVVNGVWLAAFGTPLARRLGTSRFLLLSLAGAFAGAVAHWATHVGGLQPIVGASAAVSAHFAATCRFAFASGGPLSAVPSPEPQRAPPLLLAIGDRRVLAFIGAWFGINLLFGVLSQFDGGPLPDAIAWEAHIGGFLVGLLAFPLFDPVARSRPPADDGLSPPGGDDT